MTSFESLSLLFGIVGITLAFTSIFNAIYFYFRYHKNIALQIEDESYTNGGMLFEMTKFMMYGHYCLFPARAKRAGVEEIFNRLSKTIRYHLIFHWFSVVTSAVLIALSAILVEFFIEN